MSIKGIDSQIMVTRTAELVRDSSVQLRRNELMHDYLAVQSKAMEKHGQEMVEETVKAQEVHIHKDKEGDGQGGGQEGQRRREEAASGAADDPLVPSEPHIIDIKI